MLKKNDLANSSIIVKPTIITPAVTSVEAMGGTESPQALLLVMNSGC
jgi:hypothetical protein